MKTTPSNWPKWPFTKLTPQEMSALLKSNAKQTRQEAGEALV